jgi:hypothetical protein
MNYDEYISRVRANYSKEQDVTIERYNTKMFYDEKFEFKWVATKLKIFSYVSYAPRITEQDITHYSEICLAHALVTYKGLPRGFQNGVVSFNLLASEMVDDAAIAFAKQVPKKHYAAAEMPIVFDLSNNRIHYCEKTPMWGAIYYKYFREYIDKNFNVR